MRFFGLFCFFIGQNTAMPTDNSKNNELSMLEYMKANALEHQKLQADLIKTLQDTNNLQEIHVKEALEIAAQMTQMTARQTALLEKSQPSVE